MSARHRACLDFPCESSHGPPFLLLRLKAVGGDCGRGSGRGALRILSWRTAHDGSGRQRRGFRSRRAQIELLAGLKVSTKSVERHAEQIGAAIMRIE